MNKLTPKQDAFVKAYLLNNGNATQAAIDAGYSEKTARFIGTENLTKPNIAHAITQHQKKSDEVYVWTKADKLKKLEKLIDRCLLDDEEKGVLNGSVVVAALKEHNLMQGDNAPTEVINDNNTITEIKMTVVDGNG